jgi:hypothetical protein
MSVDGLPQMPKRRTELKMLQQLVDFVVNGRQSKFVG